jgi:hypothetical protein
MKRDRRLAALPVALSSIVVGIAGIVSPDYVMTLRRLYFATPGLFYAVVAVRFASGLGVILSAASSRWPLVLRAIGVVVCLQGLSAALLRPDHAQAILEWEGMQGAALLRAGAAVALATGAFIVFAVTRGASERKVATRGSAKNTTLTNLCMTACAAVACTSCIGPASTSSQDQTWDSSDRQAIGAVVAGYASTWNSRDMKGMHELDTEDVEWINVAANSWKGRTAVQTGHDTILRRLRRVGLSPWSSTMAHGRLRISRTPRSIPWLPRTIRSPGRAGRSSLHSFERNERRLSWLTSTRPSRRVGMRLTK